MGDLVPFKLPPGFFRNGTAYESMGRWYDGNLVRWQNGRIKPWGGWRRVLAEGAALTGAARAIIAWRGNTGFRYSAIGTNEKLYIGAAGAYSDLGPNDLVTGRRDAIEGPGYGVGPYGEEEYGVQRSENVLALDASTWSFDTWGQNLVGVLSSDGRLLEWSPIAGGDAAVIANAPTNNIGVIVTDERHLMALGAGGDRRKVQWCSQGNNTVWTVSATTTAGSRLLQTQGNIVKGRRVAGSTVIWTTEDLHALDYIGPPLIYASRLIAEKCGLISPNADAGDENTVFWMGIGGFFTYDGVVRPMDCEVQDYVFGTSASPGYNKLQRSKIYAGVNSKEDEITWYYPGPSSIENDRYVTYNKKEKVWYFGMLERTCWLDAGVFTLPIAVDPDGVVYEHEIGLLADGASRNADIFLTSGPAEIGNGDRVIRSNLMLPDVIEHAAIQFKMQTRQTPMGAQTEYGPYPFTPNSEGYVPIRITGRQAGLRIEQIADADWSIGKMRFKVSGGGKR